MDVCSEKAHVVCHTVANLLYNFSRCQTAMKMFAGVSSLLVIEHISGASRCERGDKRGVWVLSGS